jgi:hypothetical protein
MKKMFLLFAFIITGFFSYSQKNIFKEGDKWIGSYQCSGDKLNLEIAIDEVQDDIIKSRFIFLNGDGEYEMIGKINDNEFVFMGTNWIKNPNNHYVTLGLHGFYLKTPDRLVGNTLSKLTFTEGNECTGFYLERKKD